MLLAGFDGRDPRVQAEVEALLAAALEAGEIVDAVLAQSGAQADRLWRLREAIVEDIARRIGLEGFIAFAPDALTPLGGYPGDEDKARERNRARFGRD